MHARVVKTKQNKTGAVIIIIIITVKHTCCKVNIGFARSMRAQYITGWIVQARTKKEVRGI
jgi:hypothetical protein